MVTKRSLGIDLGVPNTALTLLSLSWRREGGLRDCTVVSSAMLANPLSNLTDKMVRKKRKRGKKVLSVTDHRPFTEQLDNFLTESRWMIANSDADVLTAERFIGRGFTPGGALSENISMMNMGFVSIAKRYRCHHRLVSSAIWKNQLRRSGLDLEQMYQDASKLGVSSHVLDSCMIALFGSGDPECYGLLLDPSVLNRLFDQLANAQGF